MRHVTLHEKRLSGHRLTTQCAMEALRACAARRGAPRRRAACASHTAGAASAPAAPPRPPRRRDVQDVARAGMWDTLGLEGPSCVAIRGSAETEDLPVLEALYQQARASF